MRGRIGIEMHKEKIVYKGKEIEVDTFDTVIDMRWSKKRIMKAIGDLLQEDAKYKRSERLTK